MKKFLVVSCMVALVSFMVVDTVALAVPLVPKTGNFSFMDNTLELGNWKESFENTDPGQGGSKITAESLTGQWSLTANSSAASNYVSGGPVEWAPWGWNWVTPYGEDGLGELTIQGSLTSTGDPITFNVKATNWNTDFFQNYPMLAFDFIGGGTWNGYEVNFEGKYIGNPYTIFDPDPPTNLFTDLAEMGSIVYGIQMCMDIEGPTPSVPEPATMLLFGCGLIGLAGLGRKKFFKKS
jgi:hypothetical protein